MGIISFPSCPLQIGLGENPSGPRKQHLVARGLQSMRLPVQKPDRCGASCKGPKQEKGNPASDRIPSRYFHGAKGGTRIPTGLLPPRPLFTLKMPVGCAGFAVRTAFPLFAECLIGFDCCRKGPIGLQLTSRKRLPGLFQVPLRPAFLERFDRL